MKAGEGISLIIVNILVSILWIKAGYHWGWVALMWVSAPVFNIWEAVGKKKMEKRDKEDKEVIARYRKKYGLKEGEELK